MTNWYPSPSAESTSRSIWTRRFSRVLPSSRRNGSRTPRSSWTPSSPSRWWRCPPPAVWLLLPAPEKKKVKPALIAGIAALVVVVAVGVGVAIGGGDGSDGGSGGGNPITEALAPKVTIAGQEYSAALTQLFLDDVLVDEADFQNLQEMKNLEYLSYTDGRDELDLSFVSGLPNLQMLSAHGYYVDLNLASPGRFEKSDRVAHLCGRQQPISPGP